MPLCHLTVPLHIKSLPSQEEGKISGYASVFGVTDNHGDIVEKGSFSESLKMIRKTRKSPKMLWQHQIDEPIGTWDLIKEDDHGLYVEGTILLSISKGRDVYEMVKNKMIDGLSIGCYIRESQKGERSGERILKKIDLVEISLVTFAANHQAKILSVKGWQIYQNQLMAAIQHAKAILQTPSFT